MTTAAAIHATEVIPNAVSLVQDIPLSRIQESKTNPRRHFDETRPTELADNIRLHGVLRNRRLRHCANKNNGLRRETGSVLSMASLFNSTVVCESSSQ